MRHFIFEFITGGGMAGQALPDSLAREGDMMVDALVQDLSGLQDAEIVLCRDGRLPAVPGNVVCHVIDDPEPQSILSLVQPNDYVWLIAPETADCLLHWARSFRQAQVQLLVADSDSLRVCSSKYRTFEALRAAGIPTVNTYLKTADLPVNPAGYIMKPDDGAGADGVTFFIDKPQLHRFLETHHADNHVLQPYIEGCHMSLSLLCLDGDAVLLGCNRQYINHKDQRLKLTAVGVNECLAEYESLFPLARAIAKAVPGLRGYVGVDLLRHGQDYLVVEINPRMTTAYAGLSCSVGMNIAELIVHAFADNALPDVDISHARPVRIPV